MHVSICSKGHLGPSWQEWLEGLQIVHDVRKTLNSPLLTQKVAS